MLCFFDPEDEVQRSPHELAWAAKDWSAVKELCDEFKVKPENQLFAVLNNINMKKGELNTQDLEGYSKFMVDSMLSRHVDCIQTVYFSNLVLSTLDDKHHHDYLKLMIPQGRRFSRVSKVVEPLHERYKLALLAKFFNVSPETAFEYKKLLENKGNLETTLKRAKAHATDEFLLTLTKNPKEIKELKLL
ncbi:clamp loader of DNA polymerase [Acinetobacter phage Acj9]|uniref:Sliding-clamp-loader small subunit n=1 Tax=Acinetobacter phage Acj9 TaxID=760939 RepID=E5EPP0_9CAUD|nr:clamp loader of DNA polymerase [Acinetobacter phage Acj9]ADG60006.1 gp62 clamp-loader subunit [Acinetobacter phage Acj9]